MLVEFQDRAFQARVKEEMAKQQVGFDWLVQVAGISSASVSRLLYERCPQKISVVWSIAQALGIDLEEFKGGKKICG